jgi:dTDP-4-dehydrorhamnose 3,5-epimerase
VIFTETPLGGAYVVDPEPFADFRGVFVRTWCRDEFVRNGLDPRITQSSLSHNHRRGTLRGMHYQVAPCAEVKLVRCVRGSLYDVIVDLRTDSATYLEHFGIELTADNRRALYIPEGFAHGFQTLEDATEVAYQMSEVYAPEHGRGLRWNDPAVGIRWPLENPILNERDASYPDLAAEVRA